MEKVKINASRSYDVIIGKGLLDRAGEYITAVHRPCRAFIISDENTASPYGGKLMLSLMRAGFDCELYSIPAGEEHKDLETLKKLLLHLSNEGFTRGDIVVALGGGIVGDVAGFAAAIFLRGIEFIQIPTTLLAAVDSSVGGKTGVNLPAGKNLAGAFWQPSLVLCDTDCFSTLSDRAFSDGMAETVKYGMIRDAELFSGIESALARTEAKPREALEPYLERMIRRCVELKAEIVEADERDRGGRQLLNFGHTAAHAIESASGFEISHGHAVAIGMCMMTRAAHEKGYGEEDCRGRLEALLKRLGLPTGCDFESGVLAEAALKDKKRSGDRMNVVLPKRVGRCELLNIGTEELESYMRAGKES